MQVAEENGVSLFGSLQINFGVAANRLMDQISLGVCLRMVHCGEVVFRTQYPAYENKKFSDKPLPAVGWNVLRSALRVELKLQERRQKYNCCSTPKHDTPRHFDRLVSPDWNKDVSHSGFFQLAE